jgi:hypothetical protein
MSGWQAQDTRYTDHPSPPVGEGPAGGDLQSDNLARKAPAGGPARPTGSSRCVQVPRACTTVQPSPSPGRADRTRRTGQHCDWQWQSSANRVTIIHDYFISIDYKRLFPISTDYLRLFYYKNQNDYTRLLHYLPKDDYFTYCTTTISIIFSAYIIAIIAIIAIMYIIFIASYYTYYFI